MNFQYKIRDSDGKIITGFEQAPNRANLLRGLSARGLHPIAVVPAAAERTDGPRSRTVASGASGGGKVTLLSVLNISLGKPVKDQDILVFSRDILSLVRSGVPIVPGLRDIASQVKNYNFKKALQEISEDINSGSRISEAFAKHPKIFSEFYINAVRAGEQAGRLEGIMERLAKTLERDLDISLTVKNAVRYPVIVLCFLGFAFVLMITIVVPRFSRMFAKFDTPLPVPTRIIIALGDFFQAHGFLVLALLFVFIVAFYFWKKTKHGKYLWDSMKLKFPVFGELMKKMSLAKFSSTLQTLYASGVVLPEALETSSRVVDNDAIQYAILEAVKSVRQGKTLSEAFTENRLFPPLVTRMVMMGEKTGDLEDMLGEITGHYDREIKYTTGSITTLIEPILTVALGLMILVFALGVFMPMWNLIKLFRH